MDPNTSNLHPTLVAILASNGVAGPEGLSALPLEVVFQNISDALYEVELDRELLEQSLKIASEEMELHYQQLAQSAKLASMGEMAGNVSHEINNPLQLLLGTLSGFEKIWAQEGITPSQKIKDRFAKMESYVKRIAKIVRGLRTLGRDSSRDDFSESNLADVVDETLSLCQAKIKDYGIELRVTDIPKDIQFMSRPSQIEQVLMNLLLNACDAIEMHPETHSSKWIEFSISADEQHIRFQINDSGPGVPEEIETKIMDPFFTTKPVGKGTGLGLSVSQAIAKEHGGILKLNLDVGRSCFLLEIQRGLSQTQAIKAVA